MNRFSDYIKQETLAISIINKMPSNEIHSEKYKLMSNEITIGIAKIIS
jgi:hypothetical protein